MPNVMAAQPNIGGTLCESSVSSFLVLLHKVWLCTAAARVPCSHNANTGERKTGTQSEFCSWQNAVRGQDPPKMYIQCTSPGDGKASCKVWLASGERRRCSNEANTGNPLKFAGVSQTRQQISATSVPKFTILWERMEEILLFNQIFFDSRYMP